MKEKQKTIKTPVTLSGTGLHTGNAVNLTFNPAPVGHGYVFRRTDLPGQPCVKVDVDHVFDTSRGTSIRENDVSVHTIEHTMAALSGLSIDNCLIDIDGPESPIMDGSARFFVEALENAGLVEQEAERNFFAIKTPISYTDKDKNVELIALPAEDFRVSVMIDYKTTVLDTQNAVLENLNDFSTQIAQCRTFVFLHELELLLQNNLIKGGDLNNAIVFVNRIVSQEELDRLARVLNKPTVKVLNTGILNNLELHFQNEPARHKLLDVIGDLTLVGRPIKAHIIARRPGHHSNVKFAKLIKEHILTENKISRIPRFDLTKRPIYDINDIKRLLPHRPPFLFVDRIIEMSDHHVVGLKNVTMNEGYFVGHFPDEPVMPGVLQVEALAQCGGVFVLSNIPEPGNYNTYFLKINEVKFRHKVVPGDTLIFVLELLSPLRRGICHMKGVAYVGNNITCEATLLAQVMKNEKAEPASVGYKNPEIKNEM